MYTCAQCGVLACAQADREKLPSNCPIRKQELLDTALETYQLPENRDFYITASELEALGYCQWPRIKEIIQLCLRMHYQKIGLAFCKGLKQEAKVVDNLFRKAGLNVVSVICKAGGVDKCEVGIPDECKLKPGQFEPMCNPIFQAMLLNQEHTEFNVLLGLCVGHDTMFMKYSEALCTTLAVKDRVTGHNPLAAIYCADGYFRNRIL